MFYKNFFDESISANPGTLTNLKSVFTHRQVLIICQPILICVVLAIVYISRLPMMLHTTTLATIF